MRFVPHHVAHAASALARRVADTDGAADVLVLDGRGECASHLAGTLRRRRRWRSSQRRSCRTRSACSTRTLTEHLGFLRSCDEYKVMAMASYGTPRFLERAARARARTTATAASAPSRSTGSRWSSALGRGEEWTQDHADLAASVQARLEEVLLELAGWLHERTGGDAG